MNVFLADREEGEEEERKGERRGERIRVITGGPGTKLCAGERGEVRDMC